MDCLCHIYMLKICQRSMIFAVLSFGRILDLKNSWINFWCRYHQQKTRFCCIYFFRSFCVTRKKFFYWQDSPALRFFPLFSIFAFFSLYFSLPIFSISVWFAAKFFSLSVNQGIVVVAVTEGKNGGGRFFARSISGNDKSSDSSSTIAQREFFLGWALFAQLSLAD